MVGRILARVGASLLRDLVIPWVISAACIVIFLGIVHAFGLLAWPVCFCIFLYVCVQRAHAREAAHDGLDQAKDIDRAGP